MRHVSTGPDSGQTGRACLLVDCHGRYAGIFFFFDFLNAVFQIFLNIFIQESEVSF